MGIGKSSRPGKRSSSSAFSTVSTVIFVAFCILGVYILSSSSLVPSRGSFSTTTTRKFVSKDVQPQVDEPKKLEERTVAIDGDHDVVDVEDKQEEVGQEETEKKPLIEEVVEEKHEAEKKEVEEEKDEQQGLPEAGDNQKQEDLSEANLDNSAELEAEKVGEGGKDQEDEEQVERKVEEGGENGYKKEEETQQENLDGGEEAQVQSEPQTEMKMEEKQPNESSEEKSDKNKEAQQSEDENEGKKESQSGEEKQSDPNLSESFPETTRSEESTEKDVSWSTQVDQSESEKERHKDVMKEGSDGKKSSGSDGYSWALCNTTAGADYIPCLDNEEAIRKSHRRHYEHRERHCPEEPPTCLVPKPEGYKQPIEWPKSRDKIWYHNVPHTKLAVVKGHQNWVKVTGEYLTFPGGGTQFIHGALHYIDFIRQAVPKIAWGKRTRVILDVGCGVASFGGYLFDRDVLAMSFAPKDEHEAQVQFALERGIPAISAVMGTQRLPFPSKVFDVVHCARCRVPWHEDGGMLLLELNRILRPGGYFVWSATPVYQKLKEDVEIWNAMKSLTASMCWDLITIKKDKLNGVGAAIFRKPNNNECYNNRKQSEPPMCQENDDPNAAWYTPLQACMHKVPVDASEQGAEWPVEWPRRLRAPPHWLNNSQTGVYGKPAPADFNSDYEHWKQIVGKSYLSGLGIDWSNVRNVMDMRAVYGGFAAALNDLKLWVMNVVNVDSPDTLPIIYERGLFGIYHDWCESFSTYPRTYDLLHADHLFSGLKKRCNLVPVIAEVDRLVRPGGKLIVRDEPDTIGEVESLLKSLHWEIRMTFSKDQLGMLSAQKTEWRPTELASQ